MTLRVWLSGKTLRPPFPARPATASLHVRKFRPPPPSQNRARAFPKRPCRRQAASPRTHAASLAPPGQGSANLRHNIAISTRQQNKSSEAKSLVQIYSTPAATAILRAWWKSPSALTVPRASDNRSTRTHKAFSCPAPNQARPPEAPLSQRDKQHRPPPPHHQRRRRIGTPPPQPGKTPRERSFVKFRGIPHPQTKSMCQPSQTRDKD